MGASFRSTRLHQLPIALGDRHNTTTESIWESTRIILISDPLREVQCSCSRNMARSNGVWLERERQKAWTIQQLR